MQESLYGFFSQKVNGRRCDLVFRGVLSCDRAHSLAEGNRDDFKTVHHLIDIAVGEVPNIVKDEIATSSKGSVIIIELIDLLVSKAASIR